MLYEVITDDFDAAHALHEKMGCICYENKDMGIYFINDPDGYWLEVVPRITSYNVCYTKLLRTRPPVFLKPAAW